MTHLHDAAGGGAEAGGGRVRHWHYWYHRKLPGDLASTFRADKITLDMISPYQAFISACDNSRSS